jgi:hypothetical protein
MCIARSAISDLVNLVFSPAWKGNFREPDGGTTIHNFSVHALPWMVWAGLVWLTGCRVMLASC